MKHRLVFAALLLASACSQSPESLAKRAQQSFAAHDFSAARIDLAEALKQRPGDRDLLILQARTLIELGDGDGAGTAIGQLTKGQPPQGELAELAANAALLRRAPDLALSLLDGATSIEAARLRATAALQKQDIATAQSELDRAVAAGGSARAYSDYARLLLIKNDIAGASAMQTKAEKLGGDQLATMLTGGELAVRKGDLARALSDYTRADKAYPQNVAAIIGKASVLGDLGRLDEMEKVIQPLANALPEDPTVTYLQARLAKTRSDWGRIKALVQPMEAKLNPQDPLRLLYAEALSHTGQAQQAAAQAAPIARANPGNREALRVLAEAQLAAGDADAAAATYRPVGMAATARPEELALFAKILQAANQPQGGGQASTVAAPAPKSLIADLSEGDTAMRQGNWARAATAYDHILSITDGKNVLVLNNLAFAKSMLGDHDRAQKLADQAVALAPTNASVLDTAGWVRFRGDKDLGKAKELIAKAAQLAPGNAAIREHLQQVQRKAS